MDRFSLHALITWFDSGQLFSVLDAEGLKIKSRPLRLMTFQVEEGVASSGLFLWLRLKGDLRVEAGRRNSWGGGLLAQPVNVVGEPGIANVHAAFIQSCAYGFQGVSRGQKALNFRPDLAYLPHLGTRFFRFQGAQMLQVEWSHRRGGVFLGSCRVRHTYHLILKQYPKGFRKFQLFAVGGMRFQNISKSFKRFQKISECFIFGGTAQCLKAANTW